MDISCPNCSKKYRVEDTLIPENGRKVRCRKCEHVFVVHRPDSLEDMDSGIHVDLDEKPVTAAPDGGTVRISQDQIAASIAKMNAQQAHPAEEANEVGIELDMNADEQSEPGFQRAEPERPHIPNPSAPTEEQTDTDEDMLRRYKVKMEGSEHSGLTMADLKEWIKEDRLLENDQVAREGSHLWARAESIPELQKAFSLHVYHQRKAFDEADNPFERFKEKQQRQAARSAGGLLGKIKSLFRKG